MAFPRPSRRRILLSAVLLASACTGAVHAQDVLADVQKNKTIRIAVPADYPPYGSVASDMSLQGLDIDMARLVAARLGVKVELIPVTSANRIPYLQSHKADLVISSLGKYPERAKVIDFSSSYAPYYSGVFAAKSLQVKTFADLAGKSVAATRGAMPDQELARQAPPTVEIRRFEDNNATVAAFVAGQVQAIATGLSTAVEVMEKNPGLNAEFKLLLAETPNRIGIAKGEDALRQKVNDIVAEAKASGALEKMSQKWLHRPAGDLPL